MRYLLAIGIVFAFGLALLAFATIRSDIQLTIAAVSLIGGFTLLGLYAVLGRLREISERLDR